MLSNADFLGASPCVQEETLTTPNAGINGGEFIQCTERSEVCKQASVSNMVETQELAEPQLA